MRVLNLDCFRSTFTPETTLNVFKWIKNRMTSPTHDAAVLQPRHPKTEGDELVKMGRYADAERYYQQVRESDPHYAGSLTMLGFVLREQGRAIEARAILESAVRVAVESADNHYLLGSVLVATGQRDHAVLHLQTAVAIRPDFEPAQCQLVSTLIECDRLIQAIRHCDEGLASLPNCADLHFIRSELHIRMEEKTAAILSCKRALRLNSAMIAAQQRLSRLLLDVEQFEPAEASYRREIELTPDHFGPCHMLGVVLNRMGRHVEAIEQFRRAIALNPVSGATHASLGSTYTDSNDTSVESLTLARESFEKAVALEPLNTEYLCNLAFTYWRSAEPDRALEIFDRAIEIEPDNAKARWARVMLWAPAFNPVDADQQLGRSGLSAELAAFQDWWARSDSDGAAFIGELQPFFLAYQEESNLVLLKQYGLICAKAMQRWMERLKSACVPRPLGSRIRLGIVSADIRLHSIWMALIHGWLLSFDRTRFEVVVFSLAGGESAEASLAREKADVFVSNLHSLPDWVAAICENQCEILLYPAIGLDPLTLKLASLRLAPVQVNSWGHPDTSGLPTIDYYVSAECFEPKNSQDRYSEHLVLLPHLGNRMQPFNITSSDPGFIALKIDLEKPVLVCPGTPYKYQPEHDHLFTDIASRLPGAQFIFCLRAGALAQILQNRVTQQFESVGLDVSKHVRFVRWLNFQEFHYLLRNADVMLDTVGFSGYNTAVQAMECGLPLVTCEGKFLRGRLASGVLRRMELNELIAGNKAEYVNLVIRLVTDRPYQERVRREIARRRSMLFDDAAAMGPFQDFLESIVVARA